MTNLRYQLISLIENGEPLVEVTAAGLLAEPMYYRQGLTSSPYLFMRRRVAELLREVERHTLKIHGLRFKIWDPWRPRAVQAAIYHGFAKRLRAEHPEWDEARLAHEVGVYVTPADDPERAPPHATGGSVDLTLCDEEGRNIAMGTEFDHFGLESSLDWFEEAGRDTRVRDNRRLLRQSLEGAGFGSETSEWWHYDYGNPKWAQKLGRLQAFYGEVSDCALQPGGGVTCRFLELENGIAASTGTR